jgi:hypothetical protein
VMSTAEQQFMRKVAHVDPKVQVRQQVFPERRIVLALVFEEIGECTVPMFPEQARELASTLIELADGMEPNEAGEWN